MLPLAVLTIMFSYQFQFENFVVYPAKETKLNRLHFKNMWNSQEVIFCNWNTAMH